MALIPMGIFESYSTSHCMSHRIHECAKWICTCVRGDMTTASAAHMTHTVGGTRMLIPASLMNQGNYFYFLNGVKFWEKDKMHTSVTEVCKYLR